MRAGNGAPRAEGRARWGGGGRRRDQRGGVTGAQAKPAGSSAGAHMRARPRQLLVEAEPASQHAARTVMIRRSAAGAPASICC